MKKSFLILLTMFSLTCLSSSKKQIEFSKEEAISKALSKTKQGTFESIELDYIKNNPIWDIEILDNHSKKTFKIDAITGNILSTRVDYEKRILNTDSDILTINEIKKIISEYIKNPIYTEISLDKDFGRKIYNIEIQDDNMEILFIIDAQTGEIIKMKK